MDSYTLKLILKNYRTFLEQIDAHIQNVVSCFENSIACKKGCDDCCKALSLFPVEALSLAGAFLELESGMQKKIITQLDADPDACPLLIESECVLYLHRPVICRTHGFPIYIEKQGNPQIDFCPKNFGGISRFSKEVLLDIEQLNTTLFAINHQFIQNIDPGTPLPERIPVSQALFLLDD